MIHEWISMLAAIPALPVMFIGVMALLYPTSITKILMPLICVVVGITVWGLWDSAQVSFSLLGMDLTVLQPQHFSRIFATAFLITLGVGGIYGFATAKIRELGWAYLYGGAALGVLYSGDLLTLFLFWEIMAIASTFVLLSSGTEKARKAALRYAVLHFLGGVLLFVGIVGLTQTVGGGNVPGIAPLRDFLFDDNRITQFSTWCILLGVLVNIAAPPFSAWLADSYPESTPTGTVFLSAFTTKTAVFVLLTLFPGTSFLTIIGLFMVFYGIIWAILENDMRRILSYSIINQVGFMVTGIGIGTELALLGVAAHAFCHIIYKALLLMSAGAVLHVTGKRKCNELGGLYRRMWLTMLCGTVGALAISAFPFTSGFISKSLISQAAADGGLQIIWLLLLAASGGVFLHAGIKFPWFVFFQHKDTGKDALPTPIPMRIAMVMMVALCLIPGLFPQMVYHMLPLPVTYQPYTVPHVVYQLELLCFSGIVFFLMLGWLKRTQTISLDWDWFYRRLARIIWKNITDALATTQQGLQAVFACCAQKMHQSLWQYFSTDGLLSRTWRLCNIALLTLSLLGGVLFLYYVV